MRALSTEARDHGNNMEGPHPPRFRATAGGHPQLGDAKHNPGRYDLRRQGARRIP